MKWREEREEVWKDGEKMREVMISWRSGEKREEVWRDGDKKREEMIRWRTGGKRRDDSVMCREE